MIKPLLELFTASQIMTPWADVFKCTRDMRVPDVLSHMEEMNYSYAPLVDERGNVTGLVERDRLRAVGSLEEAFKPITSKHLTSESTPLLDLLRLLIDEPFILVVGRKGVVGVVTRADLNKRPVGVLLYAFISALEERLASLLRIRVRDPLTYLKERRRKQLGERLKRDRGGDVDLDVYECFTLGDLIDIVCKTDVYRELRYKNPSHAANVLGRIRRLRDRVAHPVRALLESEHEVKELKRVCDELLRLIVILDNLLARSRAERSSQL